MWINKGYKLNNLLMFVLVLLMVFSAFNFLPIRVVADENILDGSQSKWAEGELKEAYSYGLTYPQIENNYQRPISREEFSTIAVKLYEKLGGKAPEIGVNPFIDTTNSEILKAYSLGIVKGTSENSFTPGNKITRQEISLMILRALSAYNPDLDKSFVDDFPFEDRKSIAPWAMEAMKFVYKNGIMAGISPSNIAPLENTSREQAIILLKRAFVKYAEKDKAVEEPVKTEDKDKDKKDDSSILIRDVLVKLDAKYFPAELIVDYLNPKSPVGFPLKANEYTIAGVQYLGRGYNAVKGKYADTGSDSLSEYYILNINKILEDGLIHKLDANSSESKFVSGVGIDSYTSSLSTSVGISGGYMLFKGSAKANFSSQSISETERRFATLIVENPQYGLYIDDVKVDFRKYINPDFETTLNSGNPEKLFNKYGTHVIRSLRMGGRLEYNTATSTSYMETSNSFEADVKASFNAGFASAGVQVETNQKQSSESFRENSEVNIRAYPAYGSYNLNPNDFKEWFKYAQRSPGISGFGKNPLIPMYELAKTPERRKVLKDAYEKYAGIEKENFINMIEYEINKQKIDSIYIPKK